MFEAVCAPVQAAEYSAREDAGQAEVKEAVAAKSAELNRTIADLRK